MIRKFIMVANKARSSERGVALIFTLGILGLLMVIALGFASTSITERKVAANGSNLTCARLLAESAANKAIALLQYYDSGVNYSHCTSSMDSDNYGTYDYVWHLKTEDGVSGKIFEWNDSYASAANINWQYVKVKDQLLGVDKIIGRVAYVIIPGYGIDPATVVKDSVDEGTVTEERLGVDVNEINLKNIDTATITSAIATTMSYTNAGGQLSTSTGTWQDFATLFYKLDAAGVSLTQTQKAYFMDWFVVNSQKDNESFWVDNGDAAMNVKDIPSSPGKIGVSKYEMAHRFNLARTDWDSLTIDDILDSPTEWTKSSSGSTYDGKGILWLKNWQSSGTFTSAGDMSKQVAANLLNYCSSSTRDVVSDVTPSNWDTTAPAYTGNKKTPYINEIGFQFDAECTVNPKDYDLDGTADHWSYTYSFTLKPSVESIDMYGGTLTQPTLVKLEGKIYYELGGVSAPIYREKDFSISSWLLSSGSAPYFFKTDAFDTSGWSETTADLTVNNTYAVSNVKFRVTKAILAYSGSNCDYAAPDAPAYWSSAIDAIANSGSSPEAAKTVYCTYQANDARQNLNDGDWAVPVLSHDSSVRTLGAANSPSFVTLAGNGSDTSAKDIDYEPVAVTPTTLSTAYVRNGAMKSPCELGFIHRAEPWRTLNIKSYNSKSGVLGRGASDYSSSAGDGGDANILDQIKMNSNTQNPMKFSLKIQKDKLLTALLTGIRYGYAPTDSSWNPALTSGGTALSSSQITAMISSIKANNINFPTRASLATASAIWTDSAFTTERTRREIIGKIVNLCSVANTEYYTAIVVAQTIKDAGGASSGITISKDLDGNGAISSASLNTKGPSTTESKSEQITNAKLGQYDFGVDEILAEQKIKLELYKNSTTGKIDILKYEYIDGN